ncbi:MAG: carbon starvation protein A [Lentisphaeria bacterium]|nr:carbon starvation protein A [Lentisphaeria bacterium]
MNAAWVMVFSVLYFAAAYVFYGRFLKKVFGIDNSRPCPSHELNDGIDYVPTPMPVLFGHHFASIAGAGPIVGPVLAAQFGWLPALLWITIGCVFIGAMHDFSAMFLSVRNKGRSIASVIENELGYAGRQLFLLFCFAALILVVTVFTTMVADSFLSTPCVATSSLLFIGMAPLFGVAVNRKILSLAEGSLIFVPLLFCCIWMGTIIPIDLSTILGSREAARAVWIIVLLYYCLCASVIPVWVLLQPRDYLNSYLLYAMMILGFAGIFAAHPQIVMPAIAADVKTIPSLFPLLFVTIACGACSGFHALVASGTSAKQIDRESHLLPVAYGGMLIEGLLAMLAICSIGYLGMDQIKAMFAAKEAPQMIFASGLGHFCESLHIPFEIGRNFIALAISAFILTSLDTATRLARFIWQELVLPGQENKQAQAPATTGNSCPCRSLLGNRWVATLGVVILAGIMAFSGSGSQIWPVFGASNQLLAALTLLAITLFLNRTKRPVLFALLPLIFMLIISIWALLVLLQQQWGKSIPLVTVSIVLLILAFILCFLGGKTLVKIKK